MGWHEVATGASYLLIGVLSWMGSQMWSAVRELERELPKNYVRRDDLMEWKEQILATLQRIENKLDNKADK